MGTTFNLKSARFKGDLYQTSCIRDKTRTVFQRIDNQQKLSINLNNGETFLTFVTGSCLSTTTDAIGGASGWLGPQAFTWQEDETLGAVDGRVFPFCGLNMLCENIIQGGHFKSFGPRRYQKLVK